MLAALSGSGLTGTPATESGRTASRVGSTVTPAAADAPEVVGADVVGVEVGAGGSGVGLGVGRGGIHPVMRSSPAAPSAMVARRFTRARGAGPGIGRPERPRRTRPRS